MTRPRAVLVITGVTLNLQAVEPNAPVSVVINRDLDAAVTSMKALATAYNGALNFFAQQKSTGGPLANAASLRGRPRVPWRVARSCARPITE